jgi:hypothetical protein
MMGFRAAHRVGATPLVLKMFALTLLVGLLLVASAPAHTMAQAPQQNALARTLFEEGVALADRGDYVGAADRFSRAYSLRPTSGIAFNWASVSIETGKLVQAEDLLLGVLRDPAADASLKAESETMLSALRPRLARLLVHVRGHGEAPVAQDVQVEVDGQTWPRAAWDVASPVDPGPHAVLLKRGEVELQRSEATLAEGAAREIVLEVPAERAEPLVSLSAQPAPVDEPVVQRPLYKNWMLWTAVGVVVAAGVVTGVVLASKQSPKDAAPVLGNATPGVLRW